MNYHRCKCGKREAWESGMSPQPCQVCSECGSTLAMHPDYHAEPQAHQLEPRYDSRTGKLSRNICTRCGESFPIDSEVAP